MLDSSSARCGQHRAIAAQLCARSDAELLQQLAGSPIHASGHGELALAGSAARVFVKLVPLTALELEPRHQHATANLFELPTYYQYRMGGHGFGSWRELELHRLANEWVLSGRCAGFPLMHHWRILPLATRRTDESLSIWGTHRAIARRNDAVEAAAAALVLFLELFPQTLGAWLRERLAASDRMTALRWAESALMERLAFLAGQGVLHMDAHLENVLTDGSQLFLGDFGLALSKAFALSAVERAFFTAHESFDRCTAVTGLVHALVSSHTAAPDWRSVLREWLAGSSGSREVLLGDARSYLTSRGPVALAMGEFYRLLRADLTTRYPGPELESLLAASAWS